MSESRKIFVEIAYDGTDFSGWQRQNNANSVQQTIEETLQILLREPIPIMGCGRTDAGVHASQFYFHFEPAHWNDQLMFNANSILPKSISLLQFYPVLEQSHARFDAASRTYLYYAHGSKSPFKTHFSSKIVGIQNLAIDKLNQVAALLLKYSEFYPFCKANHDAKTMECSLEKAHWIMAEDGSLIFEIKSNRFLRGMVRLIVGACVQYAQGKISFDEIKDAMDNQTRLGRSWSAPPEGLFLSAVKYPYI